ncbi:hypothetical protein CTAYLR_009756 [Chrysophaeum taylorii]|uniref:CCDC81 HU domain-containing protein n=1 Tax=Chrysophaeum taylorii TaxID=2483200 RepID=A0AAD7UD06_9STRA|nr:hypothetical protein CTAYLR_009756 [Chrysophaeum taylorii]
MEEILREVGKKKEIHEEAWAAVNRWILEKMRRRKGAHVPQFARFSWQIVGKETARPVFFLTESCCRAHGLPYDRRGEPRVVACAELDYSTVALRHSTKLTKDTMFWALRDITRALGARLATREVKVKTSVGVLARDLKGTISFAFDSEALRPPLLPSIAEAKTEEVAEEPVPAKEEEGIPTQEDEPTKPAREEEEEEEEIEGVIKPRVPAGAIGQAYERCVAEVEAAAARRAAEERQLEERTKRDEAEDRRRLEEKKKMAKEVQTFLVSQMKAPEAKKTPLTTPPRGPRCVADALNQPTRAEQLPGPIKLRAITGGATRGRATKLSSLQIKGDLEAQIAANESNFRKKRDEALDEERRFIAHVADEILRLKRLERTKKATQTSKMLEAWEVGRRLNNLRRLADAGKLSAGFDTRTLFLGDTFRLPPNKLQ